MRPALLRPFIAFIVSISLSVTLPAQNCFNTGLNGTVINLPCNQNCVNVPVRIPHLKSTTDYAVNTIGYNPFPYTTPTGQEVPPTVYADDFYSPAIDMPFSFCFYDSLYTQFVIGSNGIITFDIANGDCANAWPITSTIPLNGGTICSAFTTYYPKASIMAAYSDLDPRTVGTIASPPDRKIESRVEGTAPCRRFIISYYHVGVFGNNTCGLATPNTFQMVLYESTGIIEIFFEQKACASSTNAGRAILGIQNWDRDQAVAAPGKNNTVWNENNTGYRFTPSGGASRFVSCEVFDIGGTTPLAVGDTITTTPGLLDVTFPTFCPTGTGGQYVVKTTFAACDNAANQVISYDTITINKTNSLNATATVTQTSCGVSGTGTATVTVPAGIGTAPYTYVLNPGNVTLTGNSPQTFTNLTAGNYTINVNDNSGGCTSTIPVTITSTGTLAVTFNTVNTTCVGATNGSITVNPPNGTPPITYGINGGPLGPSNVFSNLAPGTYFITVWDAAGCQANLVPVTITSGASITMTTSSTPTSCTGANNGTITITAATGTPPYQYSINGGPYQASNVFVNIPAGTHFISLIDATGCTVTFVPVTVTAGPGTVTGTATATPTACAGANNGSITVTPTSGVGPYQYSLNGGPYQTSNTFNGLAAGTYTVTIREAGLCVSLPITVTVTAGAALVANAVPAATSCNGAADGTITVTPTNGAAPYTFILDGAITQNGATTVFTGVTVGTHSVIVRDAAGCQSAPITVVVAAGPALTGTVATTATSCPGVNNGTITVTATNGTAPYTYALDGGAPQAGNTFSNVTAGAHTVIIRNAAGCQSAAIPVTVNSGPGLTATAVSTPTSCVGINNGTVVVTPTSGTGPYTFVLDGTTTLTGATATFTNLATGAHTYTITDAIGCTTPAPLTITVNAGGGFTATYTATNSSCAGVSNGSITVTPGAGGTSPYTFVLNGTTTQTGATNTTFNNVASGTHSILITDAVGCQFTLNNATVNASAGFTATFTTTNTSCTGATNGSITVTPGAGGTGPYTFVLNGTTTQTGATNTTFNNVASGTHTILITDAVGCQFTLNNATVNASAGFTATFTATSTSCTGATNGSITVTPGAGGTGPYTFVLDGTTTQTGATSTTFNNIASGSHTVLITDAIGCQFTLNNANVTAGAGFTATYTATTTSCSGASNGSITVTPGAGGTGPYTFVLDGATTQTGATNTTFTNLATGAHSVLITDANGCQFTLSNANVTAGPPLAATVTPVATACPGVNNGSISVTPTNGSGPYTFVLNGTTTQTGATTNFTGVAAGSHTIVITDVNGCSSTLPAVTVASGSGINANVNPTGTSCTGATNGSIAITPTNGTGPYTFVLNGTTTQTGATTTSFGGLAAGGGYTIVVTDAIGCTGTFNNINVAQGSVLLANAVPVATTCNGAANGQITVTPTNGAGPYIFVLNGTTTQTGATNTIFTNLTANAYSIVITDAAGCVSNPVATTVNAGPAITVSLVKTDAICFNSSTGTITATASANATAPVEYSLDNVIWQAGPIFTNRPAGTHTVYIRDNAGCTNSATITIGQPSQVTATTSVQNVSCNGQSNGMITVSATGGTGAYSYSLDNITFQAGNTFTTGAGTYTVYVRDVNGCPSQANVTVTEPAVLTATATTGNATCDGGNDGTITITATGGTAPFQYAITGGPSQATNVLNTGPGTFDIVVRDANGCTYPLTAVVVGLTNNLTLTPAVDPAPICEGSSVSLQLNTNATQFAWTPATGLSSTTIASPEAKPTATIQYSVIATLGRCSLPDDILVTVMPAPVPDAGLDGDICFGQTYTLSPVGDPANAYTWSPATYLSSATGYSPVSTPDKTTVYTLSVTDVNGCASLRTDQVTVKVTPPIQVTTFPADTVVMAGAQVQLTAVSAGTSYVWSPATGLNNPNIANPIATAPLIDGDIVTYQVTTSTSAGCQGDGFITIRVYKGPEIYVATAFSPNGDGKNDEFIPFPVGIKQLKYFRVFNRWGQLMYSTTTLNKGWDGRFGGVEQPNGVFVWMAEGIAWDNKIITKKGTVTLLR